MALNIGDNFKYQGKKPNFDRDSFSTLESLKNVPDSIIDDGHISYCSEDKKTYKYNSSNNVDTKLGKWRVFGDSTNFIEVPELTQNYTIKENNSKDKEDLYYITIGNSKHDILSDPSIKWQDGIAPISEVNSIIVVSVLNNLAVWGIFK